MPSSHGVGTQSPTCALAEYGTSNGFVHPQPKHQAYKTCTNILNQGGTYLYLAKL